MDLYIKERDGSFYICTSTYFLIFSLSFRTNAIVLLLHFSFPGAKTSRRRNVRIDLGHLVVERTCMFVALDGCLFELLRLIS